MEGTNADSDRGHVFLGGRPLCAETSDRSTTWDINASNVVCRMLGFVATSTFSVDGCTFGGCPDNVPFGLSGFKCTGNETHILECPHDANVPENCGYSGVTGGRQHDIVAVVCLGDKHYLMSEIQSKRLGPPWVTKCEHFLKKANWGRYLSSPPPW